MSKGLNKVQLIGNAGRDPETTYTTSGTSITKFSIATNERRKKGEAYEDVTEWHNVVLFGKTGEVADKYVKKGDKVYIEGRIQTQSWDDKTTGQKKYKTEIIGNELILLGGATASSTAKDEPEEAPFF